MMGGGVERECADEKLERKRKTKLFSLFTAAGRATTDTPHAMASTLDAFLKRPAAKTGDAAEDDAKDAPHKDADASAPTGVASAPPPQPAPAGDGAPTQVEDVNDAAAWGVWRARRWL